MYRVRLGEHKTALAIAFLVVLWIAILVSTGSVFSGYHIMDDHEILYIDDRLTQSGFWATLSGLTSSGFEARFRPLYTVHRVIETAVFGDNLLVWSIYTGVLAILASLCLFGFARKIGLPTLLAAAFPLLALLGAQSPIWWRLGPNETIGMVVLSASLLLLGLYAEGGRRLYAWLFVALGILASLAKESFVALLPALMFAIVWIDRRKTGSWTEAGKRDWALISVLAAFLCAEALVIILYVGTEGIGYAGISGVTLESVARAGVVVVRANLYFGAILVLFPAWLWITHHHLGRWKALVRYFPWLILLVLVVGPQLLLYAKSGMAERYLLPAVLGVALLIIYLFRGVVQDKRRWVSVVAAAALSLVMVFQLYSTTTKSVDFSRAGETTGRLLTAMTENSDPTTPMLIVADPADDNEFLLSIKRYMEHQKKGDLYLDLYPRDDYDDFQQSLSAFPLEWYGGKTLEQVPDRKLLDQVLITRSRLEQRFLDSNAKWFDPETYAREEFPLNPVVLYSR